MDRRISLELRYEVQRKDRGTREWDVYSDHLSKHMALAELEHLLEVEPDFSWQVMQYSESKTVIANSRLFGGDALNVY